MKGRGARSKPSVDRLELAVGRNNAGQENERVALDSGMDAGTVATNREVLPAGKDFRHTANLNGTDVRSTSQHCY